MATQETASDYPVDEEAYGLFATQVAEELFPKPKEIGGKCLFCGARGKVGEQCPGCKHNGFKNFFVNIPEGSTIHNEYIELEAMASAIKAFVGDVFMLAASPNHSSNHYWLEFPTFSGTVPHWNAVTALDVTVRGHPSQNAAMVTDVKIVFETPDGNQILTTLEPKPEYIVSVHWNVVKVAYDKALLTREMLENLGDAEVKREVAMHLMLSA